MAIAFGAAGTPANADNAAVTPTLPGGMPNGAILCVFAGMRTTAATLSISAGYTEQLNHLNSSGNPGRFALWWRVVDGTETNPTVTPSGGCAGDVLIVDTFSFTGVDAATPWAEQGTVFNGATNTANIGAITGITIASGNAALVLGFRSDDWTSVSTLTADSPLTYAEITEADTTTGNDAGIVADYAVNGGGSAHTAANRTFTVTGGSGFGLGVFLELAASAATAAPPARILVGVGT